MRKVTLPLFAALMLVLTSCAGSGPHIGGGFLFTSVKGPITSSPIKKTTKEGKSCASNFLGWIAIGDNSIMTAKQKGGVTRVSSVDYSRFGLLGLYSSVCTIVKGV